MTMVCARKLDCAIKYLCCVVISLFVASCAHFEYYRPESSQIERKDSICNGDGGPPEIAVIKLDGVTLEIKVDRLGQVATVEVGVYHGSTFVWETQMAGGHLKSAEQNQGDDLPVFYTTYKDEVTAFLVGEQMPGVTYGGFPKKYKARLPVKIISPEEIVIERFYVSVNEKVQRIEDIIFRKTEGYYVIPINC